MPDETARSPRFPYIAALLCAACLGAAGWTWMRYSYAWDATPRMLLHASGPGHDRSWEGAYVSIRGQIVSFHFGSSSPPVPATAWVQMAQQRTKAEADARLREFQATLKAKVPDREYREFEEKYGPDVLLRPAAEAADMEFQIPVRITSDDWAHRSGRLLWNGRVVERPSGLAVDTTASRFHPATIAGLVVGAMGVFVFGAALRHWMHQRKRFGDAAPGR